MSISAKFLAMPAIAAAVSLCAVPASAAVMPISSPAKIATQTASYGGWGWGRDHHRHRRDRVDAGDILAGVLILGGIAAVANAASRANQRQRSYPYPDQNPRYRTDARGIDGAVDMCVREVERNARVDEVARVERNAGGWQVSGSLATGGSFDCSIGPNGQIESLDIDGDENRSFGAEDRQYDDGAYAAARARLDAPNGQAMPAYPGGPVPGEDENDLPEYPGA